MVALADDSRWLRRVLHNETVGGALMLVAAAAGLVLANSSAHHAYESLVSTHITVPYTHISLSVEQWASDFLLAFFFLIAGAELKHELAVGSLSSRSRAVVPICAAISGMVMSIALFIGVAHILRASPMAASGWAIPSSTDIAFALAVLAIAGRGMHPGIRVLLLSVAVVNDVGSIAIIAIVFAAGFKLLPFVAACLCIGVWAWMQHRGLRFSFLYAPVFLAGWYFMFASGVHATIAGMAFGLATSTRTQNQRGAGVEQVDRALRPWVAGFAVPVFGFVAAGVSLRGFANGEGFTNPLTIAIVVGLVIGQPLGVGFGSWLALRTFGGQVAPGIGRREITVIALLAGVGFTVALLVSELTFQSAPALLPQAKIGILIASVVASCGASIAMTFIRRQQARTTLAL